MSDTSNTEKKGVIIKPRKMRGTNRKRTVGEDGESEDSVIASVVNDVTKKKNLNTFSTKKDESKELDVSHSYGSQREQREAENFLFATNDIDATDRKDQFKNKITGKGPIRSSANIRVTARMDYQKDICKDYFETGFCGYGDNCKFAHIREDYKSSWELDREWDAEQKKKQRSGGYVAEEKAKEKDDGLPWACFICRQPFKDPVVTNCKHYFCEKCALDHYNGGKQQKCFVCNEPTNGVFNTAREIINKMKKKEKENKPDEERDMEKLQKDVAEAHQADRVYKAGWAIKS